MNYCIINGKKSTMVKGLMIQSLPAITKPLMRTRIEEIDGRDGDIVTKLGYSAYNRELSIGLFGDFDMSEVAQFFDSEGEVIFSNELDKKYKFQILDQINYERLGRFKQAIIRFHVQPFKYPTVDDSVELSSISTYEIINNYGNVNSKPTLKVTGDLEGRDTTITISEILPVAFGETIEILHPTSDEVSIDIERMNATYGFSVFSANRVVRCNYENLRLIPGRNYIACDNASAVITITNVTRWI